MVAIKDTVLAVFMLTTFCRAYKVFYNTCLVTSPSFTLRGNTLAECVRTCYKSNTCEYVTYWTMTSECEVFHAPLGRRETNTSHGSVLLDLDSVAAYCERRGQFCGERGRESASNTGVCGDLPPNGEMEFLGNTNMHGDKRVGVCPPGQHVDGPNQITCLPDGAWTTAGTCRQYCPRPQTPLYVTHITYDIMLISEIATVIASTINDAEHVTFFIGSTALFGCSPGTGMIGSNTSTCISGNWTDFPECRLTTMRQPCSLNVDCLDPSSECRDGACWCNKGLSFSTTNLSCVASCDQYGTTFQEIIGTWLQYTAYYERLGRLDECKAACLSPNTYYMCESFDINTVTSTCYINQGKVASDLSDMYYDSYYAYYQRDCL